MVVDDHPAIREAISAMIENAPDFDLCGAVGTAEGAFALADRERPDVAVIDVSLPDSHGLNLIQTLVSMHSSLRVVVYTVYNEMVYAERAIRAGALGYVMKQEPTRTVQEAIRCVARNEVYLSRQMASRIITKSALKQQTVPASPTDLLTDREVAVLQLLGQGCSVGEIASRLHISRKTVETHRRHTKEKLEFDTVSDLLMHAVRWSDSQNQMSAQAFGSPSGDESAFEPVPEWSDIESR